MRIMVATDAWHPQVNGVVRTLTMTAEAAKSFGMSPFTLYRRIIIPAALRRALPAYSNEVILMLHSTSLAFTATVPDILKVARDANSATYASFESFSIAGALYASIAFMLIWIFRKLEHHWLDSRYYEQPTSKLKPP